MTRRPFGGTTADFVDQVDNTGVLHADSGARCTFFTAATGGTQIIDLTDLAGNPITSVSSDNYGQIPSFFGPNDGTAEMWVSAGGTSRQLMIATDLPARVYALENGGAVLPSQTGNSGEFLTTNGSIASWGTPGAGAFDPIGAAAGLALVLGG